MAFLKKILQSLGAQAVAIESNQKKSQEIFGEFERQFPISVSGRIDWEKIHNKEFFLSKKDWLSKLKIVNKFPSDFVYIICDNSEIPIIKSKLPPLLENINTIVAAPSFYIWIFSPTCGWVAELHNDKTITIGFVQFRHNAITF